MLTETDYDEILTRLQNLEKCTKSSRWLFMQIASQIIDFPKNFVARFRASRLKRIRRKLLRADDRHSSVFRSRLSAIPDLPFQISGPQADRLTELLTAHPAVRDAVAEIAAYRGSDLIREQVAAAVALDPDVGLLHGHERSFLTPWNDGAYHTVLAMRRLVPPGPYDAIVLMPHGMLGGADFVAGVLAHALVKSERVLVLRTESPTWERPDWYPAEAPSIDLSAVLKDAPHKTRLLYTLIEELRPKRVFNVNSRLCFDTFVEFGRQLSRFTQLYAYYFCADRTPEGVEVGYPIWYFSTVVPHLTAALFDTRDLAETLTRRYTLPPDVTRRMRTLYTPAVTAIPAHPVEEAQTASRPQRRRPRILWAGRLDRQKRFDLFVKIVAAMGDVDFDCWGKAVLDAPPDLAALPPNLTLHPPFAGYDDLPLADCDGWLYTSAWDGLPTILIELAALGMPITASAVGGVPELVDDRTGWPVRDVDDPAAYVAALRAMLADPADRRTRVAALVARVAERHSMAAYEATVRTV